MLTYTCERCGVTVKRARGDEGRGRFCSVKCGRAAQVMKTREERFWAKVKRGAPDECWDWTGSVNAFGYGRMRTGTREANVTESAHRISIELALGRPPIGFVNHRCDRPLCVNPAHLYEGNAASNARDRDERHRNGMAKLTDDQVRAIRTLHAEGWRPIRIARTLGVAYGTALDVIRDRSWRHVA